MNKALIFAIVIAVALVGCKTSKNATKNASAYKPAIEKTQNVEEVKQPVATIDIKSEPEPEAPIVVRSESLTVASGEDQSQGKFAYYVIIGSFANADNAKKLKSSMLDKGFSPVVMQNENGMYRVSIMQTNTETDARNMISEIRANFEVHKDVWLLKRK